MFNHILVPLDGSSHSLRAAETAVDLAQKYASKLTLLHVARKFTIPEPINQYLRDEQLTGEPFYAIDDATQKVIIDMQHKAQGKGLIEVHKVFLEGKSSRSIVEFAENHQVDAMVMGSQGLSDIGGVLLGKVPQEMASLAEFNVIIVK